MALPFIRVNSIVEASSSSGNSLLCKIREDVGDLYKWQMFRPSGLHQRQISHADNNTTIIHDVYRVFIDIIKSNCSIIYNGHGFLWLEKASQADGLKTVCMRLVGPFSLREVL